MSRLNLGRDLYVKGRIGWRGLSKDEYLETSDYKIINATSLMDGYVDWDNCGYISKERYFESNEIMLQEGDILISKDGTLGKIGYVKNLTTPCTVASGIFVVRNTKNKELNFDYLYHILKSNVFKDFIRRNKAQGSTISHLYQRDLENFEINLPSYEEQTRIANILNLIDNNISNNTSIIGELEIDAKLMFDNWFIQFDFPDENDKPYMSSGGKLKYSKELKREIPLGWEVGNLYRIADFINGLACQKHRPLENEPWLPVIKIGEMHDGIDENTEKVKASIPLKNIIEDGDILFSWSATLETMIWSGGKGGLNQHIFKVVPKDMPKYFVYMQLSSYIVNFVKMAQARKTTMGHITSDHLKQSRIVLPPIDIANKYQNRVKPLFEEIVLLNQQNRKLAELRNFLLPLLMNGQAKMK